MAVCIDLNLAKENEVLVKYDSLPECSQREDAAKVCITQSGCISQRSRKDLSLVDKKEILIKYDSLPKCSQREAAAKLGIAQSSLSRILQNRDLIMVDVSLSNNVTRKRKRDGKASLVEEALLSWYNGTKLLNEPISRRALLQKAEQLAKEFGEVNFVATDGWLSRWKLRNNLAHKKPRGEKQKADIIASAQNWFSEYLPLILRYYTFQQIFNADETMLYFRALPEYESQLQNSDKASIVEKYNERVTVFLACNMAGNKEIPLVIGKSKYPRSFRGVKTLPVLYEYSKDGEMTREMFINYLLDWDKKLGCEKIVLILESCYIHLENIPLKNIKMIFLPSDTSIVQPLNHGIINTFKSLYRKNIGMRFDDSVNDNEDSAAETSQEITLLDALHMIANVWLNINPVSIFNSFKKSGFYQDNDKCLKINVSTESDENECEIPDADIDEAVKGVQTPETEKDMTEDISDKDLRQDIGEYDRKEQYINEAVENEQDTDEEKEGEQDIGADTEEEGIQVEHPSVKETRIALAVIRKTMEQRGASLEGYGLFYRLENEVSKLLQKTS